MQPLQNCIGPTIRIGREIRCLPYAGFFKEHKFACLHFKYKFFCWVVLFLAFCFWSLVRNFVSSLIPTLYPSSQQRQHFPYYCFPNLLYVLLQDPSGSVKLHSCRTKMPPAGGAFYTWKFDYTKHNYTTNF